ncbi:MAG: nucleotide exchange factor GrpE [Bacteroidota bacterium]
MDNKTNKEPKTTEEVDKKKDMNETAEATQEIKIEDKEVKTEAKEKKKGFFDKAKKDTQKKTEELQAKVDELNDKYLRLFSEFDNFRKRTLKEKAELISTASEGVINALLPVVDDFERAIKAADDHDDLPALKEGIHLIYSKLTNLLQMKGVQPIVSIGEVFNTDFHEAITNIPVEDEAQKGKVIDEVQKGYTLGGKVIRFSKVVVAN